MVKLELDEPINDLAGRGLLDPLDNSPVTVRTVLANALARGQTPGQEIRCTDLALRIFKATGPTELDNADIVLVKGVLERDQFLNNLSKAAVLTVLNGADSA